MKIVVIGGGPGGLYFALLMKKRHPTYEISVYERYRRDDTFGFGVVFSDETLDNLMDYDRQSYAAITKEFSYWDEIDFHFHDSVVRSTGHGFCGTERRSLAQARQDLEWAELVLLWGGSELDHRVSTLYSGSPPPLRRKLVHTTKRGIAALLESAVAHLQRHG